jgi:hypothetical protein
MYSLIVPAGAAAAANTDNATATHAENTFPEVGRAEYSRDQTEDRRDRWGEESIREIPVQQRLMNGRGHR